ncbi:MAG: 4Fe-4S binding protein [Planctomycetota bacterium]
MPAVINAEECTACGTCEEACPAEAIKVEDVAVVDEEKCTDCGSCVEECPVECIKLE